MNKENILNELRSEIDEWIAQKENRNIVQLAKKSDVNETSIRRAYNQQSLLKSDNLLKLLVYLKDEARLTKLINRCPESIARYLKNSFPHLMMNESSGTKVAFELDEALNDFYSYVIYKRISHRDCVSRQNIFSWLGELGKTKLDELIGREIISEDINGTLHAVKSDFSLSPNLLKRHTHKLIDVFFKPDQIINGGPGMLRNISESVNIDGYKRVQKVLLNASNEILKTINENPGEIPLVYVGMLDSMSFTNKNITGAL